MSYKLSGASRRRSWTQEKPSATTTDTHPGGDVLMEYRRGRLLGAGELLLQPRQPGSAIHGEGQGRRRGPAAHATLTNDITRLRAVAPEAHNCRASVGSPLG